MILCLDYGERYIGVAVTDPDGRIALRHSTIDQKKQKGLEQIAGLVEEEKIKKVLVGVPISLAGGETAQTHASLVFMEQLREVLGKEIEVEGVDETLTSVEAGRQLKFEGAKLEEEHAEAARLMLADYIALQKRNEDLS